MNGTSSSGTSDLLQVLINLSDAFPAIFLAVLAFSSLGGVMLFTTGVYGFSLKANGARWASGREVTTTGCISNMLIGAVMTALMWATAMTKNTLIGESVSNGALSFQTTGMSAQQTAALTAIFGLFAVCGIVAVLRGWTMLNGYFNGARQEWGGAIWFLIGGAFCVYLDEVLTKVSAWTGFDVIHLLFF